MAADVQNPLLGPGGATRIYGPQKGLCPADLPIAERALRRLARVVNDTIGEDFSKEPGAGAAGGLGFACMAFLGAKHETGFNIFAQYSELKRRLKSVELVLTGEGQIDASTLMGKGVGSLAQLCQNEGIPCLGFSGTLNRKAHKKIRRFNRVFALTDLTTLDQAKSQAAQWLELLAAEAAIGGATLVANELVPTRAQLVRNALAVFKPAPEVLELDGRLVGELLPGEFDRILLDAPCTGLGALRRRPEARWRKQPRDVAELAELQFALLRSAAAALKPGGLLAYVTCSPHLGETRVAVQSAVRKLGDSLTLVDTQAVIGSFSREPLDLPGALHVQLWPHRHGTDAMFMQLLQKAG